MAGVFPTAGAATGSTSPLPASPSGPGNFPSVSFSRDFVKLRFFEPNVPKTVNQRWLGMPRGVYLGFNPTTSPGSRVLTLNVDPTQMFSLAKVPTPSPRVMVDLFTADNVELDFAAHTVWPVYVVATAIYGERTPTQGKIFTRATPADDITEITICKVDGSGSDLVVETDFPVNRQPPIAFNTQPYGYMPESSIADLATTTATVAEVISARDSAFTGPHGSLGLRIDEDASGTAMADRLGLRLVNVISNVHQSRTGSSFNVSDSFTETGRELGPTLTLGPNGSEVMEGVLTSGTRNFCFVIDSTSGQRIVSGVSGEPVYGQLAYTTGNIGGGKEIQFVNASVDVNGNGTNPFGAPLQEGDLVQGPDGLFYEIESIVDTDNAVLGAAYRGVDESGFNAAYRRWTLFLFTISGGPYSLSSPTNIRFLFPCFFRTDRAIFDGTLFIKRNGERPQLPVATDTVAGKSTLAIDSGLVGSFKTVKGGGLPVGTDVHTLNFTSGGAVANPFLPGVVDVSVQGAQGAPGPDANTGPQGLTGPPGFGFSVLNSFEDETPSTTTVLMGSTVAVSHMFDWTTGAPAFADLTPDRSYAHVSGGWSHINGIGGNENLQITFLGSASLTETLIQYRIEPNPWLSQTTIACYMGASQ